MRNEKGQFIKGFGFWEGKRRPGMITSSTFKKGCIPWNKGMKKVKKCKFCLKDFTTNQAKPRQLYCSVKCAGLGKSSTSHWGWAGGKPTCRVCEKIIRYNREFCKDHYKKENHHWWKGGITGENIIIRTSLAYKKWREEVFKRDEYVCQICFKLGGDLHADHIKPFALFPELRLEIGNGRTVHAECHKTTHSYLNNKITREMYL